MAVSMKKYTHGAFSTFSMHEEKYSLYLCRTHPFLKSKKGGWLSFPERVFHVFLADGDLEDEDTFLDDAVSP